MNDPETNKVLQTAKEESAVQITKVLGSGKEAFLSVFRDFVQEEDLKQLEVLFDRAQRTKLDHYAATDEEEAQDYAEQYDVIMSRIETIGDKYLIVGKAKAGQLVRTLAHEIIAGAFAVAGAVLQVGLGVVLPGVGSLIGAGLNAGLQHVVAHYLGED